MNILEKLHEIEKQKCIYNICYCKAGIGFIFYYPEKDKGIVKVKDWKKAFSVDKFSVDKYYPTFEEAVEGEYKKLKENKVKAI